MRAGRERRARSRRRDAGWRPGRGAAGARDSGRNTWGAAWARSSCSFTCRLGAILSVQLVEVGVAGGHAEAATPLHRLVAIGVCDAIDLQERRACLHLEVRGRDRIRGHRAQPLLGADHAHAEHRLVEAVHRTVELLELGEREAGEARRVEGDRVEDDRAARERHHALEAHDRRRLGEAERLRDLARGLVALEAEEEVHRVHALAGIGHHAQEAILVRRLAVRCDEGTLALAAREDRLGRELLDRLAHRALAHAVSCRELDLRGDRLAGLPLARDEAVREQYLDLLVERPAGGSRRGFFHVRRHRSMAGWLFGPVLYKIANWTASDFTVCIIYQRFG